MRELVEQTGVPKSTILYYVKQGLLPEPVKTSPNMAYYAPRCVEVVQLIQRLQDRHHLPLEKIKPLLQRWGDDADLALNLALDDLVFGPSQP